MFVAYLLSVIYNKLTSKKIKYAIVNHTSKQFLLIIVEHPRNNNGRLWLQLILFNHVEWWVTYCPRNHHNIDFLRNDDAMLRHSGPPPRDKFTSTDNIERWTAMACDARLSFTVIKMRYSTFWTIDIRLIIYRSITQFITQIAALMIRKHIKRVLQNIKASRQFFSWIECCKQYRGFHNDVLLKKQRLHVNQKPQMLEQWYLYLLRGKKYNILASEKNGLKHKPRMSSVALYDMFRCPPFSRTGRANLSLTCAHSCWWVLSLFFSLAVAVSVTMVRGMPRWISSLWNPERKKSGVFRSGKWGSYSTSASQLMRRPRHGFTLLGQTNQSVSAF